jgi:probable rRNA maturation factor
LTREGFELVLQDAALESGTPALAFIEDCARRAFGDLGDDPGRDLAGELVVRIIDEAESAMLNERYCGKQGPTNVLAFPADDPPLPDEPKALGDLAICAAVVAREAGAQGKAAEAHWAHMVIHGCLHLRGFDHLNEVEAELMEARERELLAGLGIGDPYAV